MENLKYTFASNQKGVDILINLPDLHNELKNIDISKYTDKITAIGLIFECFPKIDPTATFKEFKSLKRKTKVLELYLVLDYDRIVQGSDQENLEYIKEVFLQGCETFLKPLKDFDYNGFINEVKTALAITT